MESFEKIYQKYKSEGFQVLAFPSNTFNQEPLENETIEEEYYERFHVTYPVFSKIYVNGEETCSLYQYLKEVSAEDGHPVDVEWNFEKFLVDRQGRVVKRYFPQTEPEDIEKDIQELL